MRKTTAKKRARPYMAARLLAGAGVLALIVSGFFGGKTQISETPFETVRSAVTAAARLEETQEGDNQMLRRLFGHGGRVRRGRGGRLCRGQGGRDRRGLNGERGGPRRALRACGNFVAG